MAPERYTLSSLLNKMMDVVDTFSSFLSSISKELDDEEPLKQSIQKLISFSEKKLKDIEWIKSFVVEMTLEPITGLNINEYLSKMDNVFNDMSIDVYKKVELLVQIQVELYNEVADALKYISIEAAELFRDFSKKLDRISLH